MVRIEEQRQEGKEDLVGMTLDELARAGAQRGRRVSGEQSPHRSSVALCIFARGDERPSSSRSGSRQGHLR